MKEIYISVRKIAKQAGISPTTLYSIIQKDSNIRFDFALRLANILEIDVNEICGANPFSGTIKPVNKPEPISVTTPFK